MKNWIKLALVAVAGFAGGFAAGYYTRKHTGEVAFVEVTEEELENATKAASETHEAVAAEESKKQEILDNWRASKPQQYDTRSEENPDDVLLVKEEDLDIPDDENKEEQVIEVVEEPPKMTVMKDTPDIQVATTDDWYRWTAVRNPEYDPIELTWYASDNVICDERGQPMERPERYIGYDIERLFEQNEDTSDDPDIRVLYNHRYRAIYYIERVNSSYARKMKQEEFGGAYDDDDEDYE